MTYPVHISDQKFKNSMGFLIISNKIKSHYVHIKGCSKFMFNKAKSKKKKYFCRYCLQCFNREIILVEHRKICLKINGKQSVKLKSGLLNSKSIQRNTSSI